MPAEVKKLKPPYLVLSNHVGFWDPFVVGNFLPHFVHFVSSDAAFRNKLQRFFLTRLGTIPKKKNMRDTKVIRDILNVIAQGESVGIFPEAVRNWSGSSFPMDPSIAKLIKLLKVPVVVPIMKGMNLFHPRWSGKIRRTKVEVSYQLLFTKAQVDELTEKQLFALLSAAINHDEVAWQKQVMNPIRSKHKAEFINHALYVCPHCQAIDSFYAAGNEFSCSECNYDLHINDYGFFERKSPGELYFDNLRDWYNYEEQWLYNWVSQKLNGNPDTLLFEDKASSVYYSSSGHDLKFIGKADVRLYTNRIELVFLDKSKIITLDFEVLQTINPQVKEMLEIYYNGDAYRVIGNRSGISALKWEVAVNAIWKNMGQNVKLSPYILPNFR
ncbi:MAG: lysophospholipid acyltransferase family protein [Salinivirgaceae bacterium]